MSSGSDKLYRTIVRVDERPYRHQLRVIITGRDPHKKIVISAAILPKDLYRIIKAGDHLIAKVNIGAENDDDLRFEDVELAPDPDEDDGLA